jgi:hypothetical protein
MSEATAGLEIVAYFPELLARARRGDNGAMMELVQLYEPVIRRKAHKDLGPKLRPFLGTMDVVQSVHRSLIRNLRENKFTITKPEELIALAVTFVVCKVSRYWRKLQREEQILRIVDSILRRTKVAEDPTAATERRDQIEYLLRQADGIDRRLLELDLEDCCTKEMAVRLKLKENVIRARQSKLRRRLKAIGVNLLGMD